jgi:uncharacterized protein (TIRG00374 family)
MHKYIKDILKLIIFLSLGIFFVWYSLKDLTAEQRSMILVYAQDATKNNGWIYLLLCAFVGFVSVVIRGLRSVLMIEPLGYSVTKTNSFHAAMIGYLANFAFPRLGEVLRCTILQRYEKVPFQKSLGTVITERIIDTLIFGLFAVILLFLSDKIVPLFTQYNLSGQIDGLLSGSGKYIAAAIILTLVFILYLLRKKITRLTFYQKTIRIIKGFWAGLISVKDLKRPVLFVVYSLLIWICYYLMFYVCTFAFADVLSLSVREMMVASLSCVVVGTVGFVVAQGGLGAYPLLVSVVLALYGIGEEVGLAVGWVVWTTESVMYIVFGLASVLLISFQKDKKEV